MDSNWTSITQFVSAISKTIQFNVTPGLGINMPMFFVQGCVAAMVHHIFVTVALGSDIAISIVGWALSNLVYILFIKAAHIFTALKEILLFNITYVIIFAQTVLSVDYHYLHPQIHLQCHSTPSWHPHSAGV
jgi:hypothetical protein